MSTAFTSDSSVSGAAVTPSWASSFSDAAPQGTDGSQSAIRRSGFARSSMPVTPAGLPAGTASSSVFVANTTGSTARPASATVCMGGSAAEAKTSTGAPSTTCCASAALPP